MPYKVALESNTSAKSLVAAAPPIVTDIFVILWVVIVVALHGSVNVIADVNVRLNVFPLSALVIVIPTAWLEFKVTSVVYIFRFLLLPLVSIVM